MFVGKEQELKKLNVIPAIVYRLTYDTVHRTALDYKTEVNAEGNEKSSSD